MERLMFEYCDACVHLLSACTDFRLAGIRSTPTPTAAATATTASATLVPGISADESVPNHIPGAHSAPDSAQDLGGLDFAPTADLVQPPPSSSATAAVEVDGDGSSNVEFPVVADTNNIDNSGIIRAHDEYCRIRTRIIETLASLGNVGETGDESERLKGEPTERELVEAEEAHVDAALIELIARLVNLQVAVKLVVS
ncbi:hypothetical protein AYI68_g5763 [Smittium mucronatum]|uniref:Uncharacterized protein n=1 Tax=Smittium mucronatum TaxID=133383 RepID=A0A1R0GTC1_9FUNG|nr:hypothetical protein AYI68_g5763 [Smittium mucronatum]